MDCMYIVQVHTPPPPSLHRKPGVFVYQSHGGVNNNAVSFLNEATHGPMAVAPGTLLR
jgi:hypothetical protein